MSNFTGIECPVCKKKFEIADDIVVCPICGTPHHRECYQKLGHCAFEDNHEQGYQWKQSYTQEHEASNAEHNAKCGADDMVSCPMCHTENPKSALFCVRCGYNLHAQEQQQNFAGNFYQQEMYSFASPLGGVHPDADIDGVSAAEVAAYVRENSHHYLPRFKALSDKTSSICWNWSACLFGFLYFFYRKMYLLGTALMVFYCVCIAPSFMIAAKYIQYIYSQELNLSLETTTNLLALDSSSPLMIWMNVARILLFGVCIFMGLFGTRIYKFFAIRKIKKIKEMEKKAGRDNAKSALVEAGGVNRTIIAIVLGVFFIGYMAMSFFITYQALL